MKIKNAEKLAALCLAAVMGVSVAACSGGNMYATSNESATIADNDVITIGSVTTNSGAAAAYGEAEVNGSNWRSRKSTPMGESSANRSNWNPWTTRVM